MAGSFNRRMIKCWIKWLLILWWLTRGTTLKFGAMPSAFNWSGDNCGCGVIKQNESELAHIIFLVFCLMLCSIQRATFCRNPHLNWTSGYKVMAYWMVVKTIENKRIYFLCSALSPNQYLRIPTHFAWSYHICASPTVASERQCFSNASFGKSWYEESVCNTLLHCKINVTNYI